MFNWLNFLMKRVSYFATKLNSRDIKKCDCLWVPSVNCSPLLAKQYFPSLRQLAFKNTQSSLPSQ